MHPSKFTGSYLRDKHSFCRRNTYIRRADPGPRILEMWISHCGEKISLIERIGEIDSIRRPADCGKMTGERKP